MKVKSKAYKQGAFAGNETINPWLIISRHMESLVGQVEQIGFQTSQLRRSARYLSYGQNLGKTFLRNTRMHPQCGEWEASAVEYFTERLAPVIGLSGSESVDSIHFIDLPEPVPLKIAYDDVMRSRKSIRQFSGDAMELEDLATMLYACAGISHHDTAGTVDGHTSFRLNLRNVTIIWRPVRG